MSGAGGTFSAIIIVLTIMILREKAITQYITDIMFM